MSNHHSELFRHCIHNTRSTWKLKKNFSVLCTWFEKQKASQVQIAFCRLLHSTRAYSAHVIYCTRALLPWCAQLQFKHIRNVVHALVHSKCTHIVYRWVHKNARISALQVDAVSGPSCEPTLYTVSAFIPEFIVYIMSPFGCALTVYSVTWNSISHCMCTVYSWVPVQSTLFLHCALLNAYAGYNSRAEFITDAVCPSSLHCMCTVYRRVHWQFRLLVHCTWTVHHWQHLKSTL